MPRKSTVTSTPASGRGHKRNISTPTTATITPGTRSSKRLKGSAENTPTVDIKVSPKKSKYFEGDDSDDADDKGETSDDFSAADVEESGYEDEDASLTEPSSSEVTSEDDYDSDEDRKRRKRKVALSKSRSSQTLQAPSAAASKELWRPGVKAGLGPGKQVFIAKPKPRDDGGIKYVPEKIHPNTMAFLADLKQNNDREWLRMHDPDYRQSWKDWESFVNSLTEKIVEIDETIPELPPKDLVFRIYRDVRFSSDPTPYKTHFSAAWSRTGRKGPYAAYYVQIQPKNGSFVGSGLWMPDAPPLALLRAAMDRKSHKLKKVLMDPSVRKQVLGGVAKDEKKAVKAFAAQNSESALKTKPKVGHFSDVIHSLSTFVSTHFKGYEADNANIELLRLRSFTMGRRLTDEEVLGPHGLETVLELITVMAPFVTYLNSVVMPDDDSSTDEGSEEDAGEVSDS